MNDIAKMRELWQEMSSWMTTYMKSFYSPEEAQKAKSHLDIKNTGTIFFDDAQIVDGIVLRKSSIHGKLRITANVWRSI